MRSKNALFLEPWQVSYKESALKRKFECIVDNFRKYMGLFTPLVRFTQGNNLDFHHPSWHCAGPEDPVSLREPYPASWVPASMYTRFRWNEKRARWYLVGGSGA